MKALHKITYGLYVLTAKTNKYNGCIINTLMQVTSVPNRISITVNKDNFTTKMIEETGVFNVSILDKNSSFDIFKRFGFASGRDTNKFDGFKDFKVALNGVPYITKNSNSYISAKVVSKIDLGTHVTFVADIIEDVVLNNTESVTYVHYLNFIKPKTEIKNKKVYVCRICGYIYEGDVLPDDFICPICKHGADDFELMEIKEENKTKPLKERGKQEKKYYCPECGNVESSNNIVEKCVICGSKMIEF